MHFTAKAGLAALALATSTTALAQAPAAPPKPDGKELARQYEALPWVNAPAKPAVTERADIQLTPKVRYLDAKGTSSLLTLTGNLPETNSFTIAPKSANWFAIYQFSDIGYVKDDEKIDSDALLKTLREDQEAGNAQRKEQGLSPLTIKGWAVPPHYDPATHNLEYGVILASPTGTNVNYHMRMLGRRGVMDAALITSEQYLKEDLAEFREANKGFAYKTDESYAAYKEGDKISEYGLAALITGGAAAAAAKSGLFGGILLVLAKFAKLIAVGAVALFAGIARLFGRKGADAE